MVKLGDKVKCRVTGFAGTVVKRTEYLYGSVQIEVRGFDNGFRRDEWLEENGVDLVSGAELASVSTIEPKIRSIGLSLPPIENHQV